jgi:hypothetical protein
MHGLAKFRLKDLGGNQSGRRTSPFIQRKISGLKFLNYYNLNFFSAINKPAGGRRQVSSVALYPERGLFTGYMFIFEEFGRIFTRRRRACGR